MERSGTKWNEVEGRSEQMFQTDVLPCPVPPEIVSEQDAVTYIYIVHTIVELRTPAMLSGLEMFMAVKLRSLCWRHRFEQCWYCAICWCKNCSGAVRARRCLRLFLRIHRWCACCSRALCASIVYLYIDDAVKVLCW